LAKITIDALPPAISLSGSELVPIDQPNGAGGYVTKQTTVGSIINGGANAAYILETANFALPNARVLASASGEITITDGGASGNLTIGLDDSGVIAGSYGNSTHLVSITVDGKGRITTISAVDFLASLTAIIAALPTTIPASAGQLWLDGGFLSLS
jgi:hypothetical protein